MFNPICVEHMSYIQTVLTIINLCASGILCFILASRMQKDEDTYTDTKEIAETQNINRTVVL